MSACESFTLKNEMNMTWHIQPERWEYFVEENRLIMRCAGSTDLIHEPLHSSIVNNAPFALSPVTGDFSFSAKVSLKDLDGKWTAGILLLWVDDQHWAKLCLERAPDGAPSIITVVTNGWSDDGVHWSLDSDENYLRVLRTGESLVMHSSDDGYNWRFVRVFRFNTSLNNLQVGFLAQSPWGTGCTATFEDIRLNNIIPEDMRNGT